MSQLRQGNGDDYPEAAGRHMQDSGALLAGGRPDGAAYLAGYVVECALKTLIQLETGRPRYSHDLSGLCDVLDTLAAQALVLAGIISAPRCDCERRISSTTGCRSSATVAPQSVPLKRQRGTGRPPTRTGALSAN